MTFLSKDPAVSLRSVPPSTALPFEARTLLLKQSDTQSLDQTGVRAMSMFSSFSDRWEQNREGDVKDAEAMLASLSQAGSEYEVRTDVLPNRRFLG